MTLLATAWSKTKWDVTAPVMHALQDHVITLVSGVRHKTPFHTQSECHSMLPTIRSSTNCYEIEKAFARDTRQVFCWNRKVTNCFLSMA